MDIPYYFPLPLVAFNAIRAGNHIVAIEQILGAVPQVAVFDTAFHAQMPEVAAIYPGPYEWFEGEIRRYGFHGISHQYCAARAAEILDRDLNARLWSVRARQPDPLHGDDVTSSCASRASWPA